MATPPGSPTRQTFFLVPPPVKKNVEGDRLTAELDDWIGRAPPEETSSRSKAKERIINYIKRPTRSLDLSGLHLTSLPDVFSETQFYRNIEEINLDSNDLIELPRTFTELTLLTKISLNDNPHLRALPDTMGELRNLKVLHLRHTAARAEQEILIPESLAELHYLREIRLSGYPLTEIPRPISRLASLRILEVSDCELTNFDSLCERRSKLEELNLSSNLIDHIPDTVAHLAEIGELNLSDNPFDALCNEIFNLPQGSSVIFENSLLSEDVVDMMEHILNADGYRGPHIDITSKKLPSDRVVELLQYIQTALKEEASFEKPSFLEDEEIAQNMFSWLKRLTSTVSKEEIPRYKDLFSSALDLVRFAEENESFREHFLAALPEAGLTCGDKVILSILDLQMLKGLALLRKDDIRGSVEFYKKCFIMDLLKEKAKEKIEILAVDSAEAVAQVQERAGQIGLDPTLSLQEVIEELLTTASEDEDQRLAILALRDRCRAADDVEVLLSFPIKLKERFSLPFEVEQMFYFHVSKITQADIDEVGDYVERQCASQKEFIKYLVSKQYWVDVLLEHQSDEMDRLVDQAEADPSNYQAIYQAGVERISKDLFDKVILVKRPAEDDLDHESKAKSARMDPDAPGPADA